MNIQRIVVPLGFVFAFCHTEVTAGAAALSPAPSPSPVNTSGWIHVPGALTDPSCIHKVPNGARVSKSGDVVSNGTVVAHYDPCPNAPIFAGLNSAPSTMAPRAPTKGLTSDAISANPGTAGTVEAVYINETAIGELGGYMNTPLSDPSDHDGQLIYIYMGLWADDGHNLAASALQWGEADIGGTVIGSNTEWTYTQWLVTTYGTWYYGEQTVGNGAVAVFADQGVDAYGDFYASGCLSDIYGNCETGTYYQIYFYPDSDIDTATQAVAGAVDAFGITTDCKEFPGTFASTAPEYVYDTNGNFIDTGTDWATCSVGHGGCGEADQYSGTTCGFDAYWAETGTQYNLDFND
jgi:hypothetical protein